MVRIPTTNAPPHHLWIMYNKKLLYSYLYMTALQKNVLIRNIYRYIDNLRVNGLKMITVAALSPGLSAREQ